MKWIEVANQLPKEKNKRYQVLAICSKKYKGGDYDGKGVRTIVQDWVVRTWPHNFTHWFAIPKLNE